MLYLIIFILLIICIYFPSLWVKWVMHKHHKVIADMPGTGGELAEHLLQRFNMDGFKVEQTQPNHDHYDPQAKTVRLSPDNFNNKSLTAVAVAAHEVGHAIQHHKQERVFELRKKYIPTANLLQKTGIYLMMAIPFLLIIIKAPQLMFLIIASSLLLQFLGALAFLIVLPEEWDASFNKALPILIEGQYIPEQHIPAIKSVLKAAALTYFAAALASMLNIGRWLLILRR